MTPVPADPATRPGPVTVTSVCHRLDALLAEIRALRTGRPRVPVPPPRR